MLWLRNSVTMSETFYRMGVGEKKKFTRKKIIKICWQNKFLRKAILLNVWKSCCSFYQIIHKFSISCSSLHTAVKFSIFLIQAWKWKFYRVAIKTIELNYSWIISSSILFYIFFSIFFLIFLWFSYMNLFTKFFLFIVFSF